MTDLAILTHERLLALLHYEPSTGIFTRLVDAGGRSKRFKAGTQAGCLDKESGYVRICIDRRHHWAHRLAWFYVHGVWPEHDVDHKNRVRSDNWIDNLRDVTRAFNLQNQDAPAAGNKSGFRGIRWEKKRQRWRVELSVENRNRFIGRFTTIEAAQVARTEARQRLHPGAIL